MESSRIKLLILGDPNVGKKKIIQTFLDEHNTDIGASTLNSEVKKEREVYTKSVQKDNYFYFTQIWNPRINEETNIIPNSIFRGIMGVLIVYDITINLNLICHKNLIVLMNKHLMSSKNGLKQSILIVRNLEINKDLENKRQVEISLIEELSNQYELEFREISANNKKEVEDLFYLLIENVAKNYNFSEIPIHSFVLTKDPDYSEEFVEEADCMSGCNT